MKVILLAAGRSKRMYPVTDKNLLNFCGKSLIVHQLERMKETGLKDFLIVCNAFNEEAIRARVQTVSGITFDTVKQIDLEAGMAGAILACERKIGDEEILVVSSNDVVNSNAYKLIVEASANKNYEVFMLGKRMTSYFPGGYLEIDGQMHIKSIVEKPEPGTEPSDLVNVVVHFFRNSIKLFQYIENVHSQHDDRYESAIDKMIKKGVKIKAVMYDDVWHPVKYPWHIFELASFLFAGMPKRISKTAQVSSKAHIKGDVIIDDGVRVFENAVISGPCYLGKDTIVANNSLIRDSFLGDSCTVGFSTEIARSYVGNDCWFHTNYIGDSILGNNCSFGSGATTANLRLDESEIEVNVYDGKVSTGTNKLGAIVGNNVRIGVNTSLMPGVKIGHDCMIGAGIVVPEDIEENKFVRGRWLLKIDENRARLNEEKRKEMRERMG